METKHKIHSSMNGLLPLIDKWKKDNETIVFTNGCFDLIHLGHVDYLEKAKSLGDKLVVGLNSDESISKLKGESRPILDFNARSRILAAFEFVDAVVWFNEPTPLNLINEIVPNILVKGNDYEICNIIGADFVTSNGGKVMTIDLVNGYSTTSIINKIKDECN